MGAALAVVEEAAGEEAVRQTVRLVVIEGGAAAAESAVAGEAAVAGGVVVAGEAAAGGAVAIGLGGVLAATGIGLAVVGLAALGYYLYKKHQAPANRELVTPCPKAAAPSAASSPATAAPSATLVPSTAAPAYGRKDRNCDPDDCERAKEAIRDLLKGGRTEKRPLKERIDQLRENPEGQPYDYPVDPATGKHPPSEGGTVKGHLDAIINQTIRANEAIQTYYECGCTGLDESEIRELGNILSEDPLEGVKQKEPNYTTPAERIDWRRKIGKRP